MEEISFNVQISILKPVQEVFKAVINPIPFFVQTAREPLQEGKKVFWSFVEIPDEFPVLVTKLVPNQLINFEWESGEGGYNTQVEFSFKALDEDTTLVSIKESGWQPTEKGRQWSYKNCQGWMHMACCLKAFLEYGINLRKGSFVHMTE